MSRLMLLCCDRCAVEVEADLAGITAMGWRSAIIEPISLEEDDVPRTQWDLCPSCASTRGEWIKV